MRITLFTHALLMLLASTSFTVVTFFTEDQPLQWCYLKYSHQSGFGYVYESDFSPIVIATYFISFLAGLIGFSVAYQRGRRIIGFAGAILSAVGLISFAIEGSHLFVEHNRSWLAFSPAIMLVLVAIAMIPSRHLGSSPEFGQQTVTHL